MGRQDEHAAGLFLIEHYFVIGAGGEDKVILGLIHGFHGEKRNSEGTGFSTQRFENADLAVVIGVAELDFGDG